MPKSHDDCDHRSRWSRCRPRDRALPWPGSRLETLRASRLSCPPPKHKDELSAWLAGSASLERHHLGFASRALPLQRAPTLFLRRSQLGKIGCAYVARNDTHRFEPFAKSIENFCHPAASKEMSMIRQAIPDSRMMSTITGAHCSRPHCCRRYLVLEVSSAPDLIAVPVTMGVSFGRSGWEPAIA